MIQLRDYQIESLNRIWSYYANGNTGNPLIAYPTGTGKSCLPAFFMHGIMQQYPNQRFLLATHVKELISQNAEVLKLVWPEAPLGVYSAGLKRKESAHSIVYGGVQSMCKEPARFGHRDIVFIDEAHLVSNDESSQYLTFLSTLKLINPALKIIGLTATPFRMGMGYLTEGNIFTDIIHDLTSLDEFNKLIQDGFLAPLIPRRTHTELNVTGVGVNNGEFIASQLQHAVNISAVTHKALKEAIEIGQDRRSWLIFSSGIEHAENIAEMLRTFGVDCAAVHSKQTSEYNDRAIKAFKSHELRAISCYSKLTTGFNHPSIDLIIDLRPTMSIPLHIQKLGRGTRPANGKRNCIVLDFGRNVPRLGPINDPQIPRKKMKEAGDMPVKICDHCGTYNHTKVRFCDNCGQEFQFQIKIVPKAGTSDIIRYDEPIIESYNVDRVIYNKRDGKDGKADWIKCTYFCGMQAFSENIFPEAKSYGKHLFHQWWHQRHSTIPPINAIEALQYVAQLRTPRRIHVHVNQKWPSITNVEF